MSFWREEALVTFSIATEPPTRRRGSRASVCLGVQATQASNRTQACNRTQAEPHMMETVDADISVSLPLHLFVEILSGNVGLLVSLPL